MSLDWYRRHLNDTITYWAPASLNVWGEESFSTPITIKGSWENRQEEFSSTSGEVMVSNALVYVDRPIEHMGWLYLGTSSAADPKTVNGAFPIRRVDFFPGWRPSDGKVYVAHL